MLPLIEGLLISSSHSSVIRPKSESRNGGNKKTKHAKFSEKRTLLTSSYVCASGGTNLVFSENLAFSYYLLFVIRPFALSPTNLSVSIELTFEKNASFLSTPSADSINSSSSSITVSIKVPCLSIKCH